jgi:hypothetical protein
MVPADTQLPSGLHRAEKVCEWGCDRNSFCNLRCYLATNAHLCDLNVTQIKPFSK